MNDGSENINTEIVCGLPVLVTGSKRGSSVIRVKPRSLKKRRVERPAGISLKERNDLSIKQRKALSNHFCGMQKKEAGMKAGFSESYAIRGVNQALSLAAGNAAFLEEMDRQGISYKKLVTILNEGLEAKHPLSKDGNKDHRTIHSYWHDSVKLLDGFPAKKTQIQSESKHVHIHITADDRDGLDKYERMRQEAIDGSPDPY